MGLAASQARLLTITARKSDAEFQSMRYSHDKIALSRSMTDISTEYQNSLNQTKLVYDFYGNGDTNTQLSYGLMMTPSIMNGYMPMLTTNTSGRVVLNNQYAAAAEAAGIPAEGLGCLPSEVVRDKFIQGLADAGLISQIVANNCLGVSYSQDIGMGSTDLVSVKTEKMNLQGLLDYLDTTGTTIDMTLVDEKHSAVEMSLYEDGKKGPTSREVTLSDLLTKDYSFVALSSKSGDFDGDGSDDVADAKKNNEASMTAMGIAAATNLQDKTFESLEAMVNWSGWDQMMDAFENALNTTDPGVKAALEVAREKTNKLIRFGNTAEALTGDNKKWAEYNTYDYHEIEWYTTSSEDGKHLAMLDGFNRDSNVAAPGNNLKLKGINDYLGSNGDGFACIYQNGDLSTSHAKDYNGTSDLLGNTANAYIGYVGYRNMSDSYLGSGRQHKSGLSISVSNIAKAYLTYFIQAMEGMSSQYKVNNTNGIKVNGITANIGANLGDKFFSPSTAEYLFYHKNIDEGTNRTVGDSNLIDVSSVYQFDVVTQIDVNKDHAMISGFYDALFNQICSRGWTENSNIDDNEYLAQMYQNGKYFLATCSDDGYYNAGNYSTNTYIREVTDDDAIAKAEAKYNTEKLKINQKEEIIDLKMKNLDTEISSLTTEYDTVKSVISKQIEKSFKRYDA